MRKCLLLLLLCLLMLPAALAEEETQMAELIPADILMDALTWHPSAQVEGYAELPDVDGEPMAFLLFRDNGCRTLYIYRRTEEGWLNPAAYTSGIPQGEYPDVWFSACEEGNGYSELWFDPEQDDYEYPSGPVISIWTSNGETHEERVEYVYTDGDFRLLHYGDNPVSQVDVVGDMLVFYNISDPVISTARHTLDLSLRNVDFYALPRQAEDVRIMGEEEPPLHEAEAPAIMDRQNFLQKQEVTLQEGKYPVYMGPGKAYGRAANGKGTVSTNGWIQVFGEYDGWLLIQYGISAEQYRFGWITADALAPGQRIEPLSFVIGDVVTNCVEVTLTDDPLNSRTPLLTLPENTCMEYLIQLGGSHAYVRVEIGGKVWWGFVPAWPLGHG